MSKRERKDTRIHLVAELEKLPRTPAIQELIDEAKAGEYHDYKNNKYACGKVESSRKLRAAGLIDLAKQIENGDFDETADEEDKQMLNGLIKDLATPQRPRPVIAPRIRGKAVQMGARWGWEIMVTFEADRTIASLPSVDAQLVQTPESLNLKSEKDFSDKQSALRDLEDHANNVFRLIMKELGDPNVEMMDARTMERGIEFKDGRIRT